MIGLFGVLRKISRGVWGRRSGHLWQRIIRGRDRLRPWSVKDTEVMQEK